jgi:predicted  nucleic acid-binding Zn-ribbon protein
MDGLEITGIAVGIPTITSLLLAAQVGRWRGKIEQMLEGHEKAIAATNAKVSEGEKSLAEAFKEQRQVCQDQKTACAKLMSHIGDRVNGIKDR